MEYLEITVEWKDLDHTIREMLPYWLEPLGFEGFHEDQDALMAFIAADRYDREAMQQVFRLNRFPEVRFRERVIPRKNWNELWESNFEPVVIGKRCLIRAPFHKPRKTFPIEIILEPKMSFGTGHHATTALMAGEMLETDLAGKSVLDAGCGSGILAILAEKLGATRITALDADEWSIRNAKENIRINCCRHIKVALGDATAYAGDTVDILLANINLPVLTAGMENFSRLLKHNGDLFISGILARDVETIRGKATLHNLEYCHHRIADDWALVRFKKSDTFIE
jgi:ribosomal protein L11 methyltransferase